MSQAETAIKIREDVIASIDAVLARITAKLGENEEKAFVQGAFEALIVSAGYVGSDALGHGATRESVEQSLRTALTTGMRIGIDAHEVECKEPGCSFRESVEAFLLAIQPTVGSA